MKLSWLLPLALLAPEAAPPAAPAPSWADRLAWNARERTARGLEAIESEAPAEAVPAFDTALRLRPDDPLARFNAGTARLEASDPAAAGLLEEAARQAGSTLAPAAWYNAGNARLGGGDPASAIEAYREALRREPGYLPAKHNLEIALRELEKQQQEQDRQQEQAPQDDPQQQKKQEQEQESDQGQEQEQEQEQAQQPQPPSQDEEQEQEGSPSRRPPPQFQDQEDMTAEQAAALLQAVEDLERQQRRERALDQARQRATVEKDW